MSLSLSQETKQNKSKQGGISVDVKGKATGLAASVFFVGVSLVIYWHSLAIEALLIHTPELHFLLLTLGPNTKDH